MPTTQDYYQSSYVLLDCLFLAINVLTFHFMSFHAAILTDFLVFIAHSSSVSAASYLPCRLYNAPKFFSVVVTVGLQRNKYS